MQRKERGKAFARSSLPRNRQQKQQKGLYCLTVERVRLLFIFGKVSGGEMYDGFKRKRVDVLFILF